MSQRQLSPKEALLLPSSTQEDETQTTFPSSAFCNTPSCTVFQAQERSSIDHLPKVISRRTKASRWRKFHRDPVQTIPHNFPSSASGSKTIRQRWYSKFKRDYTSATSVSHLDRTEPSTTDQPQLNRISSFHKLQRGVVVVQSDTNSHTSCGSVSKNYSLDSTKSDGLLNKAISIVGDPPAQTSSDAPVEHDLPAVTLTVPAEDLVSVAHPGLKSRAEYKVPVQGGNFLHLCDYCALSQPSVYTSLMDSHSELNTCVVRRHSHCGCSFSASTVSQVNLSDQCLGLSELPVSKRGERCSRCQRQTQRNRINAFQNIYPPTRNRNASCSGIDVLADAILQTHSKVGGQRMSFEANGKQASGISFLPTFLSCATGRRSVSESKPLCSSTARCDSSTANRLRMIRKGEGKNSRDFAESRCKRLAKELSASESGSFTSSNIKPPMLVTPTDDIEQQEPSSDMPLTVVQDKDANERLLCKKRASNVYGRSAGDFSHGFQQMKMKSVDSPTDNSLKVPLFTQMFPKRTSATDDDLPLDSRIRRVSMILLSRYHQASTSNLTDVSDQRDGRPTMNQEEQTPLLFPPLVTSPPQRTRFLETRQDTDTWSLVSASRMDSPKHTRNSQAVPGTVVVPLAPSMTKTVSIPTSSPPNARLLRPVLKEDDDQSPKDIRMRYRRLRRPTERYSKGIGYHLGRRRHLLERRRRMADFSLAFGMFGIVAAFLDTELVARSLYSKTSIYSYGVRLLISLSTIVLLALIVSYHAYDVMIFLCEEYIKDWRISVTRRRVLQVITELFICSIHPVPGVDLFFHKPHPVRLPLAPPRYYSQLEDAFSPYLLLILPMIGRFYLAFRTLLLHSKMFNDAGSRSIGSMNKICFDLRFVLKTLMTLCPVKTLLVFIVSLWLILSWTLRACELEQGEHHLGLLNSAWLISVTFLSIGYGDIVPHTSCGRLVAVTTGLMGSACTALLVAVFSRKLEMTKAEKHVLHFMEANKITKRVKHCAANVLRETWLLYKNAKLMPSFNPNRVRVHQRKFLQAIYSLRTMKVRQRELQDKSDSLVDLAKLQTNVFEGVADIALRQDTFQQQLQTIEQNLIELKKLILEQRSSQSAKSIEST